MQLLWKQVPYIAIFVCILQICLAVEQKTNTAPGEQAIKSKEPSTSHHVASKDEIFIDDDGLEGSGNRASEVHEDLEKEHENSGSGFGPDDEDMPIKPRMHKKPPSTSTTPKYSTAQTVQNNKQQPESSTTDLEEGSGIGVDGTSLHFDEEDGEDVDDGDDDDDKNNAPTVGTGDDFTTEVKKTDIDASSIDKEDSDEEDPEDPEDPEEDYDAEDHINPSINEGTKVNAEVPRHGSHYPDQTTDTDKPTVKETEPEPEEDDESHEEEQRKETVPNSGVSIQDPPYEDKTASFFAQPGILIAIIGGAVVGLLCAILVVMFIVYRMRKKDEGSYVLEEPKRVPASYAKSTNNREFFA